MIDRNSKILMIGSSHFELYAPAWYRGLTELGYNVTYLRYDEFWLPGILGRIERRFMIGISPLRINRQLIRLAEEIKPDVILLHVALPIFPSTVERLAKQTWVSTYFIDNPFGSYGTRSYFRYFQKTLPYAHSHHVNRLVNVSDYQERGYQRVKLLRMYYLPWVHRRLDLPPDQPKHDIVFIGHGANDQRIGYVKALLDAGLDVQIYGPAEGWTEFLSPEDLSKMQPIQPIRGDDYARLIAASKICLCFFSQANRDTYTGRVFEITAIGGFLMCQRTDDMLTMFEEDAEAVYFSSPEELVEKCRYYLEHEADRQRIQEAGHRRCLADKHDIVSRMEQWLHDIAGWMSAESESAK